MPISLKVSAGTTWLVMKSTKLILNMPMDVVFYSNGILPYCLTFVAKFPTYKLGFPVSNFGQISFRDIAQPTETRWRQRLMPAQYLCAPANTTHTGAPPSDRDGNQTQHAVGCNDSILLLPSTS